MARRPRKMEKKRQAGSSKERANRTILGRTMFLMVLCGVILFIPLIATLYKLMITEHDKYEEMAIQNQTRSTTLTASRGMIYDRNMNILASSATVETIFLDPNAIQAAEAAEEEKRLAGKQYNACRSVDFIARGLSEILDVDADFIREQAADTAYYYKVVKRKVSEEKAQEVRKFINDNDLTGLVNLEMDSQRYYPYGSLAAQILGFVRSDNVGAEGLESYYDATLTGNAGAIITTKGNQGTEMLYTYEKYYDASDGNSLVLTLDVSVQHIWKRIWKRLWRNMTCSTAPAVSSWMSIPARFWPWQLWAAMIPTTIRKSMTNHCARNWTGNIRRPCGWTRKARPMPMPSLLTTPLWPRPACASGATAAFPTAMSPVPLLS